MSASIAGAKPARVGASHWRNMEFRAYRGNSMVDAGRASVRAREHEETPRAGVDGKVGAVASIGKADRHPSACRARHTPTEMKKAPARSAGAVKTTWVTRDPIQRRTR
jgi:hypothetical protein